MIAPPRLLNVLCDAPQNAGRFKQYEVAHLPLSVSGWLCSYTGGSGSLDRFLAGLSGSACLVDYLSLCLFVNRSPRRAVCREAAEAPCAYCAGPIMPQAHTGHDHSKHRPGFDSPALGESAWCCKSRSIRSVRVAAAFRSRRPLGIYSRTSHFSIGVR
jgi:hypothetical protein